MKLPFHLERPFLHFSGHCWRVRLPGELTWAASTNERPRICPLALMENGVALASPHSAIMSAANSGEGRYSVWHDGWVYFSSSDNSAPSVNGRGYQLDLCGARPAPPAADATLAKAWTALERDLDSRIPPRVTAGGHARIRPEIAALDKIVQRYDDYRRELEQTDATFLSIMCSGRTWVRFFLQQYFAAATGVPMPLEPRSLPPTPISPSICFTHDFLDLFETAPAGPWIVFEPEMAGKPVILMTRDLRDTAVSWFYYLRVSQPDAFRALAPGGTLAELIDSPVAGLERLAAVHETNMAYFGRHKGRKLNLRYEHLKLSPESEFLGLLAFLSNAPVRREIFEQALRASSFDQMQALEIQISRDGRAREYMRLGVENWSGDRNDLKVRNGEAGGFRAEMPELADPDILARRYPLTARIVAADAHMTA